MGPVGDFLEGIFDLFFLMTEVTRALWILSSHLWDSFVSQLKLWLKC